MRYIVDRIENDIVVLENYENGNIINKMKSEFNFDIKEKDIILYGENNYILDNDFKEKREKNIEELFNMLKSNE